MVNPLLEVFVKKDCKKQIQKKFRIEKIIKEKVINCILNEKDMIIRLIVGLIKKMLSENTSYKNESILS